MRDNGSKPTWLMDLCKNKVPGVILIDGDNEKAPCLDLAYEIGATMVETGSAERLCVWSWQVFLWLHGRYLIGDSAADVHCWTITKDAGIIPPPLQPLAGTLVEDNIKIDTRKSLMRLIYTPKSADGTLCVCGGDLTIADFKNKLSLPDMERVNGVAKRAGTTIIVVSRLVDAQSKPYENIFSYSELAMRISIEQGIDLTECAESIVSLREQDYGHWRNYIPAGILCRPLKIWDDDTCSDEFVIGRDEQGRLIYGNKEEQ